MARFAKVPGVLLRRRDTETGVIVSSGYHVRVNPFALSDEYKAPRAPEQAPALAVQILRPNSFVRFLSDFVRVCQI